MVEETIRFASENLPAGSRIGLLSTSGTHRAGSYRNAFRSVPFSVVTLEDDEMADLVHLSIYHIGTEHFDASSALESTD